MCAPVAGLVASLRGEAVWLLSILQEAEERPRRRARPVIFADGLASLLARPFCVELLKDQMIANKAEYTAGGLASPLARPKPGTRAGSGPARRRGASEGRRAKAVLGVALVCDSYFLLKRFGAAKAASVSAACRVACLQHAKRC